jgi:hypothetical protein
MIVRAIDGENDWQFGKGKNDYKSNNSAIAQNIKTRLQSFLGDCFFDVPAGIDWFNLLGSKNQIALELSVRTIILNTVGVVSVVSSQVSLDSATRLITMNYVVNTVFTVNADDEAIVGRSSFLLTESGDILTTEDGDGLEVG